MRTVACPLLSHHGIIGGQDVAIAPTMAAVATCVRKLGLLSTLDWSFAEKPGDFKLTRVAAAPPRVAACA